MLSLIGFFVNGTLEKFFPQGSTIKPSTIETRKTNPA